MVDYDGFASLDTECFKWFAKLYRLCSDPAVEVDDLTIRKQHIKALLLPEVEISMARKRGGRGGGGRGGGRGRRGRGRGRGPPAPGGDGDALEDGRPSGSDGDAEGSGGSDDDSLKSPDRAGDDSPAWSDEDAASDATEMLLRINPDLEACVCHALTISII